MTLHWDIVQGSDDWHHEREENIGSSEIAVLFGCGEPYHPSLYELWAWKSGRASEPKIDDRPGSYIWYGKQMEPVIANMAALLNGWRIRPGPYAIDDECEGMAASLDFVIDEPGPAEIELGFTGPGVLEIKNINVFQHREKWVDDQPTDPVVLQLQDETACSGYTWGAVCSLVGGNDLRTYRFPARAKIHRMIRDRVTDFWRRVAEGDAPPIDGKAGTGRALDEMYEPRGHHGVLELTSDEAETAAYAFFLAAAHKEASDRIHAECENVLKDLLAGAMRARTAHHRIVRRGRKLIVYERKDGT